MRQWWRDRVSYLAMHVVDGAMEHETVGEALQASQGRCSEAAEDIGQHAFQWVYLVTTKTCAHCFPCANTSFWLAD